MIELYSRYIDNNKRLHIVIERFGSFEAGKEPEKPNFLKVLNVNAETANTVSVEQFNKSVEDKKLTLIPKQ